MTVTKGSQILFSDYNNLREGINLWFADKYAGAISFGYAYQTYGWGGSSVAEPNSREPRKSSQLNSLIDRCNIGEDIADYISAGPISQIEYGSLMESALVTRINTESASIDTNRLDIEAAEMSLNAGGASELVGSWSSAAVDCTFRYTLSDFDEARYFFNSCGAFNIFGTITGYSTGTGWDGAGIDEILTDMGTILMNYTETTQSGSGGTPTSIGYYDLTTSYQTIFSQAGTGAYTDATVTIQARYGSSGAYVEILVTLTPEGGRDVDGTTTITTQYRKLDNQSSGSASLTITAPSYSLINGL